MSAALKALIADVNFQATVLALIVLNALCMGIEATPSLATQFATWLIWIFWISQLAFVGEIVVRILAHAPAYRRFFADSWNRFDFAVVLLSLLPVTGDFALVARLLRILRVLRIVSVAETLRGGFASSSSRPAAVLSLLVLAALLAYCFTIAGVYLLGERAPAAFGSLAAALRSIASLAALHAAAVLERTGQSLTSYSYFAAFYFTYLAMVVNLVLRLLRPARLPERT